jgi:hypothetical protein
VTGGRTLRATLSEVTRSAMDDMRWLSPSDAALRTLALKLAEAIDANATDPDALAVLTPKFHSVLRDLGGTPASRRELNTEEPEADLITELRVVK